jgi:hypothetical protein
MIDLISGKRSLIIFFRIKAIKKRTLLKSNEIDPDSNIFYDAIALAPFFIDLQSGFFYSQHLKREVLSPIGAIDHRWSDWGGEL